MTAVDLVARCAFCGEPMAIVAAPPRCRVAADADDHHHVRCNRCSPAGWAACVRLKVSVAGHRPDGEPI